MPENVRERRIFAEDFTWHPYRIKPLAVWAMRMNSDFQCWTLECTLHGKAGDWLVRADDGWTFPVQDAVFKRYYVKREWRKPYETSNQEGHAQGHETPKVVHAAHDPGQL